VRPDTRVAKSIDTTKAKASAPDAALAILCGVLASMSVAAFALMVAGIVALAAAHAVFAHHAVLVAVQIAAVLLMIAARVTFGRRSFHAAANPTSGGLVTTGPYAFVRHPIYAAVLYFVWAGALDTPSTLAIAAALLVSAGAVARIAAEERLLVERYPEYADYMRRVRRVVPFVF
jgi:protein-S-isoprenylcysteine O-methyltransferase Ste14